MGNTKRISYLPSLVLPILSLHLFYFVTRYSFSKVLLSLRSDIVINNLKL